MNRNALWFAALVVLVVLAGATFFATRHSHHVDARAAANGTGVGVALDPTTGNTVPADATPGALNAGPAHTVSAVNVVADPAKSGS